MLLILREILRGYRYFNDEISDPRMATYPLLSNPFPAFAIFFIYIRFAKVGPQLMEGRKPFKLDRVVQAYDVLQVLASFWIIHKAIKLDWFTTVSWTCEPVDYSTNPRAIEIAEATYAYFIIKITDLLDTVFFVLRKKNNQITFLHVYHHAGMVLLGYFGSKYVAGGHSSFLGVINAGVHAVMYSYYLFTSIYQEQKKNIWWKKHITQMQMIQFLLIALHQGQLLFRDCDYPIIIPMLVTPMTGFVAYLFYDFYQQAYCQTKSLDNTNKNN